MADQAYLDAITAFTASLTSLTDPDDIAAAKTVLDNAFTALRAKQKAAALVPVLAQAVADAQAAVVDAQAAHAAALADTSGSV